MHIKHFCPFLLGIALAGGTPPVAAQVLEGSNGSRSELAPLSLNKQTARQLSTRHTCLRADFAQSNRHYLVVGFQTMLSPQSTAVVERHAQILAYLPNHLICLPQPNRQTVRRQHSNENYSHSIVEGGLEEMS